MNKIAFMEKRCLRIVYAEPSKYATNVPTYYQKLYWRFANKTVHEWVTNKRMKALFVHSCNIRGRFAIPHKVYDNVISSSNAAFRWYYRISPGGLIKGFHRLVPKSL